MASSIFPVALLFPAKILERFICRVYFVKTWNKCRLQAVSTINYALHSIRQVKKKRSYAQFTISWSFKTLWPACSSFVLCLLCSPPADRLPSAFPRHCVEGQNLFLYLDFSSHVDGVSEAPAAEPSHNTQHSFFWCPSEGPYCSFFV